MKQYNIKYTQHRQNYIYMCIYIYIYIYAYDEIVTTENKTTT